MKIPAIKILSIGKLLDPNECFIFTCGTLLYTTSRPSYEYPDDNQAVFTSNEWEWADQDLDIFSSETYEEFQERRELEDEIETIMEDL